MQSLASLMSTGAMMSDIAPLEDLEGEEEGEKWLKWSITSSAIELFVYELMLYELFR